jgi:thiol-disulfide isomerase/thioredoxin
MLRLLYYTASWCGPCKVFKPQAEQEAIARGLRIEFIDVDSSPDIAGFDNIMSVPTIVIVGDDKNEVDRVVGASLPTLKKTLDKLTR